MSTGLIALLDDVVGLAKVAAASIDDAAGQASRAGAKAAGVVVDDAAVTPRYVTGFSAERELPIIGRIAVGSLKNKLLYLLPLALLLSLVAPWAITPLLMLGGAFLCYEGAEKVYEAVWPHAGAHGPGGAVAATIQDAHALEEEKVSGAIKTDFILSAEIMAITLSTVAAETTSFWGQAVVLAVVGIGITLAVYGTVALIVKADDVGLALARNPRPVSTLLGLRRAAAADPTATDPTGADPTGADRALAGLTQGLGRGLVRFMPAFLKLLGLVGTAAMLWVGGGIVLHGLEVYGLPALGHAVHAAAHAAGHALEATSTALAATLEWLVGAAGAGLFGLALGALLIPLVHKGIAPLVARLRGRTGAGQEPAAP
ncbi:DUF808 domain-containing protein [Rhodocista pekingensis]|uniref:DUF808 domain-containing protein n=1 Tax=Rhodocista pekingensis TaxID=201185 RepID=A0ABW2KSU3_9PROT